MSIRETPLLRRPYPATESWRAELRVALVFGLFVGLFLYIFRPFGLGNVQGALWLVCVGYGGITFAGVLLVQVVTFGLFAEYASAESWTVGREILQVLINILVVATGNLLFSAFLGFFALSLQSFFLFIGFTLAVAVFPVSMRVMWNQRKLERRHAAHSAELNTHLTHASSEPIDTGPRMEVKDDDDRVKVQVLPADLLFLESADNYVTVYFLEDGTLRQEMVRGSLNRMESELVHPDLFRTHRSYLVNTQQLEKVHGNARGYQLQLRGQERLIPVARRRIEAFDRFLHR